jgi:alcohol dehydrogenase
MSRMAPVDPTAGGNPVPLDVAACRRLYEAAAAGRI